MADAVTEIRGAVAAAVSATSALGLSIDQAMVLRVSNRLTLRLLPADVLARVARSGHDAAQLEVDVAARLVATHSPVAAPDPRVAPRVHDLDGFAITLWRYYPPEPSRALSPADYADALFRLHAGMRRLAVPAPHFTDRVMP